MGSPYPWSARSSKLDGGEIVAIDRSAKMTEAARKRDAHHIASGKATVETVSLHEADFGTRTFDKVFGIHFPERRPCRARRDHRHPMTEDGLVP